MKRKSLVLGFQTRESRYSTTLILLFSVCFIVLLSSSVPETTRDTTTIRPTKNEFFSSSTLGTHSVDTQYYKAYISKLLGGEKNYVL